MADQVGHDVNRRSWREPIVIAGLTGNLKIYIRKIIETGDKRVRLSPVSVCFEGKIIW